MSIDGVDVAAPEPDEEDDGLGSETLSRLMAALVKLPPRERQAVCLRHFEELPATGIAAQLGVSQENARLIVHRGLQRLRRYLEVAA